MALKNNNQGVRSGIYGGLLSAESTVELVNFVLNVHFIKLNKTIGANSGAKWNVVVSIGLTHFEADLSVVFVLICKEVQLYFA